MVFRRLVGPRNVKGARGEVRLGEGESNVKLLIMIVAHDPQTTGFSLVEGESRFI